MMLTKKEAKDILTALIFSTVMVDMEIDDSDRNRMANLIEKISFKYFIKKPLLKTLYKPTIIDEEDKDFLEKIEKYVELNGAKGYDI